MTPKEAAKILGIEYTTVLHHLKKSGQLTGHRDDEGRTPSGASRGRWQVDPESVAAFQKLERPDGSPGRTPSGGSPRGRKPNPDTVKDSTRRSLFLGNEISPEDVARIRRLLPTRLRAAVLLRLAELAEREPADFKRALESLGIEWES